MGDKIRKWENSASKVVGVDTFLGDFLNNKHEFDKVEKAKLRKKEGAFAAEQAREKAELHKPKLAKPVATGIQPAAKSNRPESLLTRGI